MKKRTEPAPAANITPLVAFTRAMHDDWKRTMQPLCALRTGWHDAGLSGACQAFLRAQREAFPQGIFSLLLIAQILVLALLLVAVVLDGVVVWGGLAR